MATYYWVNGAGTWDSATTTNWASLSGGSGSAGVPTISDDVVIDTSSGTGNITIGTGAVCNNMTANTTTINLIGSTGTLNVDGNWSSRFGSTSSFTGTLTFTSSRSNNTIYFATLPSCATNFNGTGAWKLLSNFAAANPTKTARFDQGNLDLNNFYYGGYGFNSTGSLQRSINFGTSGYIYWPTSTLGNLFFSWNFANCAISGTSRVRCVSSATTSASLTITLSNTTAANCVNFDWAGSTTTTAIYRFVPTAGAGVRDLDFSEYNGPLYGVSTTNLDVYGNLILSSASTASYFGISPTLKSPSTDIKIIDFKGKTATFANGIIILGDGTGNGSYSLANTMNVNSFGTINAISIWGGTFNANNYNVIASKTISLTGDIPRQIIMGNGEWKLSTTSTSGYVSWDCTNSNNLTVYSNTATINIAPKLSLVSSNVIFIGGNKSWPKIINDSSGILIIKGNNSFDNITTTKANTFIQFEAGSTTNVNTIAINGTSGSLSNISSTVAGTRFTLNKTGSGVIDTYYLSILDSNATPSGAIWNAYTTNGNLNLGNNSGWNFAPYIVSTGNFFLLF